MQGTATPYPTFGRVVRDARVRLGISQTDLARAIGVTPSAISKYEAGKIEPGPDVVNRLARVLGLDTIELLRDLGYDLPGWVLDARGLDDRMLAAVHEIIRLWRRPGTPPQPAPSDPE